MQRAIVNKSVLLLLESEAHAPTHLNMIAAILSGRA